MRQCLFHLRPLDFLSIAKRVWPKEECVMEQLAVRWDLQPSWKFGLNAPDVCLSHF